MFNLLKLITKKPEAFSKYTANTLWNDSHISSKMLAFHLDASNDISSRNKNRIFDITRFLVNKLKIKEGTQIIDYGCGPGLYSQEFAKVGASVTGIDFSKRSISYAKEQAQNKNLNIKYINANYISYKSTIKADISFLIYFDLCALSTDQRVILYENIKNASTPGSYFVFEVYSLRAMKERREAQLIQNNLMNGFWSKDEYVGIMQTFLYNEIDVVLDKYDIFTQKEHREIYNWLEYFSLEKISHELRKNGFSVESYFSSLDGSKYSDQSSEIALIARIED